MHPILNFLESFATFPAEAKEIVARKSIIKHLHKGDLLFRHGRICHYMYFMVSGLARIYYYKDGKEVIDWFALEHHPFTAIDSFLARKVSRYNIEMLEDSEVYALHYDDLENLYSQFHAVERAGRLITQQQFLMLQERVDIIQFQSAQQRYDTFLKNYPMLINRVQLTHIASYLGITLETLSRIRGKI